LKDRLSIRSELPHCAEARVFEQRLVAAQAFARANRLDRQVIGASGRKRQARLERQVGRDVVEASRGSGSTRRRSRWHRRIQGRNGLAARTSTIASFAAECDELLVLEEKRGVIEDQLARVLYNLPAIAGRGSPASSTTTRVARLVNGELDPDRMLEAIAARYLALEDAPRCVPGRGGAELAAAVQVRTGRGALCCAGCPHNTSTRPKARSRWQASVATAWPR
jgi:indolepyruvate ferredoxin oxidoreductase